MAGSTGINRPSLDGAIQPGQPVLAEQARLGMIWEANMDNSQSFVHYQKVAALLFYWEGSDLDRNLRLKQEVDELADVFRAEYHFEAEVELLNHRKPQQQMNSILSNFMLNHDEPNTLSIIYYAGHGHSKDGDNLVLLRSTNEESVAHTDVKPNSIAWNSAETLLGIRKGDVFAIFDCCDAGSLCHTRGLLRFEVLGACCYQQTTRPPGPGSFTSALIWALRQLKDSPKGWFSSVQLRHKIKSHKDFPKDQIPHLSHRELESAGLDHIVLSPLNSDRSPLDQQKQHVSSRIDRHFVDLRFHFEGNVSDEALINLAENVRPLVKQQRVRATHVTFVSKRSIARDAVHHWLNYARSKRASRKQSKEHPLLDPADNANALMPRSEAQSRLISDTSDVDKDQNNPTTSPRATRASIRKAAVEISEYTPKVQIPSKRDRSPEQSKATGESKNPQKRRRTRTWPSKIMESDWSLLQNR